jgi:hypothetical protein
MMREHHRPHRHPTAPQDVVELAVREPQVEQVVAQEQLDVAQVRLDAARAIRIAIEQTGMRHSS